MDEHNVSHGDIYHKLGELQGTVQALIVSISERRSDVVSVMTRMAQIESRIALVFGGCAVLVFVIPLVVTLATINAKEQPIHPTELRR